MAENVLVALDGVRQVLADEGRPDEDFFPAADHFLQVFHANLEEQGLGPAPFETWDPRPALRVFELALIADTDLDPGYAAAAKSIRDTLDHASEQIAQAEPQR